MGGVRVGGEHRYDMHGHNPKGEGEVGSRSRELSVAASIHAWFSASKDMLLAIS